MKPKLFANGAVLTPNVYLGPKETVPEGFVDVPKGNDRMFAVTLTNLRRGKRVRTGTATVHRYRALMQAIQKRHPRATISGKQTDLKLTVRTERAGKVVLVVVPMDGPVASVATRQ